MEQYNTSNAIQEAYLRHEDERIIESLEKQAKDCTFRAGFYRAVDRLSIAGTAISAFLAGAGVFSENYKQALAAGAVAVASAVAGAVCNNKARNAKRRKEYLSNAMETISLEERI